MKGGPARLRGDTFKIFVFVVWHIAVWLPCLTLFVLWDRTPTYDPSGGRRPHLLNPFPQTVFPTVPVTVYPLRHRASSVLPPAPLLVYHFPPYFFCPRTGRDPLSVPAQKPVFAAPGPKGG